jgi:elongator complex protein 3
MRKRGWACSCIRCREAGLKQLKEGIKIDFRDLKLNALRYKASGGTELFLSFDDVKNDALAAFLRLRVNADGTAGVRELRVFGEQVAVGEEPEAGGKAVQHKSLGRKLLSQAEEIARGDFDARKLFVLSGVGVKPYYKKLGYRNDGFYVSKKL